MIEQHLNTVSIVIPTYTNSTGLVALVKSIARYTSPEKYRLIIVANGAPAETREAVVQLGIPLTMLWFNEPLGFSRACNAGIDATDSEFVVLLNDDCLLLPQEKDTWFNSLREPFSDEAVGITGSHKLYDDSTQREFVIFFCAMLRRAMIEQLGGGLDESFSPFYGEDIAMTIEAERAGWKCLSVGGECRLERIPNSKHLPEWKRGKWVGTFPISHDAETTLGQLPNHVEVVNRNRAILKQRYGPVDTERAKAIEGWMSEYELDWLATQARTHTSIVEIGSYRGRSARAFADNMPEGGKFFAVDTWEDKEVFDQFQTNLADHIATGRVVPIQARSVEAAKLFPEFGITPDLCFIDGLHDEASIRADILAWQPLLAENGLLCGHDYSDTFPDVCKVVDELLNARQPVNTGIWEAMAGPRITESLLGFGGFFAQRS